MKARELLKVVKTFVGSDPLLPKYQHILFYDDKVFASDCSKMILCDIPEQLKELKNKKATLIKGNSLHFKLDDNDIQKPYVTMLNDVRDNHCWITGKDENMDAYEKRLDCISKMLPLLRMSFKFYYEITKGEPLMVEFGISTYEYNNIRTVIRAANKLGVTDRVEINYGHTMLYMHKDDDKGKPNTEIFLAPMKGAFYGKYSLDNNMFYDKDGYAIEDMKEYLDDGIVGQDILKKKLAKSTIDDAYKALEQLNL